MSKKKILFIGGSLNQTSMVHAVASQMQDDYDCWFTPFFCDAGLLKRLHEAGKLRILATSGAKRSPWSPAVPTFKEAGLNLVATGWNTFFAPASMPKDKVERLATAIRDVMQDPDTQRKFADAKMTPVVSTQVQTVAMLKAYRAQWAPVVQKSGYQP